MIKLISNFRLSLLIVLFIFWLNLRTTEAKLYIYFLDIGQGDSILIQTPDNKYGLVDTGPDNSVLNKLSEVLPYGKKKLDFLMISHFDLDHFGGVHSLMDFYEIDNLIYTKTEKKSDAIDWFYKRDSDDDSSFINIYDTPNLRFGCCTYLKFYSPLKDQIYKEENDRSITFELIHRNFSILFGGDISLEIEEKVARENWIDVDVLKVNHHGSRTSSSKVFTQLVKPELAVISVGKGNKYGHPVPEILKIFENEKIKIRRTDLEGTIKIESDGFVFK